jgi:hypothetical protein
LSGVRLCQQRDDISVMMLQNLAESLPRRIMLWPRVLAAAPQLVLSA